MRAIWTTTACSTAPGVRPDCGDALPHASEYSISGMLIAFDDKTVWETVCAGLDLLGKE